MKSLRYLLLSIIMLSASSTAFAGAWPRAKGELYSHLSFMFVSADKLHNEPDATIILNRKVTEMTLQAYLEYGICDRFTVIASLPLKFIQTDDALQETDFFDTQLKAGSRTGMGNIMLGGKYRIFQKKGFVMSADLNIHMNTASSEASTGIATGFSTWGVNPMLAWGYGNKHMWVSVDGGVNLRTNGYSHEVVANAEVGYNVAAKNRVLLAMSFNVKQSFLNGDFFNGPRLHTGLYVNDQEYISFNIKVGVNALKDKNLSFWGSFAGGIGRSVPSAPFLSFTVAYIWKKKKKESEE